MRNLIQPFTQGEGALPTNDGLSSLVQTRFADAPKPIWSLETTETTSRTTYGARANSPAQGSHQQPTSYGKLPSWRRHYLYHYGSSTSTLKNRKDGSPSAGTSRHSSCASSRFALPSVLTRGINELPEPSSVWLSVITGFPSFISK